jgi:hypothetical protein
MSDHGAIGQHDYRLRTGFIFVPPDCFQRRLKEFSPGDKRIEYYCVTQIYSVLASSIEVFTSRFRNYK